MNKPSRIAGARRLIEGEKTRACRRNAGRRPPQRRRGSDGRLFKLDTASLSVLPYEHDDRAEPVVALWSAV